MGKVLNWRIDYLSILALRWNQCFFYILIFIPRISDSGGITSMRHTYAHTSLIMQQSESTACFRPILNWGNPTFCVHFLFWCQLHLIVLQQQLLNSYQQRAKVGACVWAHVQLTSISSGVQCFLADMDFGMCGVCWSKNEVNLCTQRVCICSSAVCMN